MRRWVSPIPGTIGRIADHVTQAEGEGEGDAEEPDEDNMEEIDMDNIVGSRTRGKNIDYAQAAKELDGGEDEDDEDDDDFEGDDDDKMQD